MKQLLFFLICGTLVYSCTITKRHFGDGYHVEWNRKMKSGSDHEESPKLEEAESKTDFAHNDITEPDSIRLKQLITEVPDILEEEPIVDYNSLDEPVQLEEKASVNGNRESETPEIKSDEGTKDTEGPKRRLHPLTWGIWTLWGIAIALLIVTFSGNLYGLLIAVLCLFVSMIFGIITITQIRRHPEKYRGKRLSYGFAIPSIVLGGVIILAGILALLLEVGVLSW